MPELWPLKTATKQQCKLSGFCSNAVVVFVLMGYCAPSLSVHDIKERKTHWQYSRTRWGT